MPANYAHYRFGSQVLSTLPPEIQRSVRRFRQLYDVGLQGPDPFFHYNIFRKTPMGSLGSTMHALTGEQCFTRACKRLRLHPSEAATAYLYGFLAHYCLDSICHPFIHEHTDEGPIGHVELESEFERFLFEKDGYFPAHTQDMSPHLRLSRNEAATAAELFPPATGPALYRAANNMARHVHLLATLNPQLVSRALSSMGKNISQQQIPQVPNENCAHLDAPLYALYRQALKAYPIMAEQLAEHIRCRADFGEEFRNIFG